ncbi:hypothetical protein [Gordonia soli]|uniref:Glycine zipper family protein n=1 Tax=Gordonia soli NBRC 108243 TaxID=1223545 RepID=M0QRI4_9ACTN|nr:hypothetical protein [Gordonia soli]GAC71094.1 hypothetical protein GS4_51_00320 [Gordonia soli NBRC 108243]
MGRVANRILGPSLVFGLALGVAFGIATGNLVIGIAVGLLLGLAYSQWLERGSKRRAAPDPEGPEGGA